jgi:hypothetical protein
VDRLILSLLADLWLLLILLNLLALAVRLILSLPLVLSLLVVRLLQSILLNRSALAVRLLLSLLVSLLGLSLLVVQ